MNLLIKTLICCFLAMFSVTSSQTSLKTFQEIVHVNGFPRVLPFGLSLFMQRLQSSQLRSLNKSLLITTSDYIDAFLVFQEIAKKLNMEFFYIDISIAPCDKEIFKATFASLKERSENSKKKSSCFFSKR